MQDTIDNAPATSDERPATNPHSLGLKRRLLYSHLSVAVIGLGILLIALMAIWGIRANALNLALESAPAVKASLQAHSGIQHSLAALRGWVALGDPKFVEEWKHSWVEEIRPATSELNMLSQEWSDEGSREQVRGLLQGLDDLEEWQWHIQDVAQAPGNHPAQAYMERYIQPLANEVFKATTTLLEFEKREGVGSRKWTAWLGDFRAAVMNTQSSLREFLFSRDQQAEKDFHRFSRQAQGMFLGIMAQPQKFSGDRQVVFFWMKDQFRGYQTSLKRLDQLHRNTAWNIAQYRLITEVGPRARAASSRLQTLINIESAIMREDTAWVTRISTLALWGSILLFVGLVATTLWMARSRAEALAAPIVQLSRATTEIAQGKRSDRLHVTGTDELSQLAQSFNVMQEALIAREGELLDAAARTKGIVDTAADGIITINEQGLIESYNKAALRIFGYEEHEALGKNVSFLMPSPYHEEHDGYLERYRQTGVNKVIGIGREVFGQRKDGTTFPLELSVSEVHLGDRRVFTGIVRDISERKQAEAEIREREERFHKIIEAAPSGMIMIDQEGLIVLANSLTLRLFGYTREELVGQAIEILVPERFSATHPQKRAAFFAAPEPRAMGSGRELFGLRKDGSEFPIEIGLNPVQTESGMCVLSSIVDISERKQAEAEKDRLNKELVGTSRRAGMADVATSVLHNVGNVLNSVNVSAGMVQQAIRRLSVDKISRTALMINEHTENLGEFLKEDSKGKHIPEYLTKLGDHLLGEQTQALSEMEELNKNIEHIKEIVSAQQNLAKSGGVLEPINPIEIMEQAIVVNLASMMRHGVEIVRDFRYLSEIIADKHQVLQILVNLISNAKYAIVEKGEPPSRMTLEVSPAEGHEGYIIWRVTDTGKGISPENMPRMFTQGFTTKKTGHGFGLHSAALSAKLMGGSLSVHSNGEDEGATFTLELPMKPEEKEVVSGSSLVACEKLQ